MAKASSGIRTHDLPLTERVLYQLSYRGIDWELVRSRTLPFGSLPRITM